MHSTRFDSTFRRGSVPALACLALLSLPLGATAEVPYASSTPRPLVIDLEPPAVSITDVTRTADGLLWLGTEGGLIRHDGRHAVRFDRQRYPTLPSNRVQRLAAGRGGTLWVGSAGGGLARFDGAGFRAISRPTSVGGTWSVTALLVTREGPLFIGTPDSLLSLDWGASSSSHGLPGVRITALDEDASGQIWAAAGSSLFRRAQTVFQPIPLALGFTSSPIADLEVVGDVVWLARDDGLVRLEGDFRGLGLPRAVEHLDGIEGPVCCVLQDHAGSIWAAAGTSLHRFDGDTRRSETFPAPITALFSDSEETLWIATDGAGVFYLASAEPPTAAPASRLLGLRVDGESWPASAPRSFDAARTIEIDVAAPTFHAPDEVTIAWRIGEDPWTPVDGPIVLDDLAADQHVVEVVAQRAGQPGAPLQIDLEIRPRWFETAPFWLAVVALVATPVAGWFLFTWRRRRIEEWLEEQEAADRADLEILDDSAVTLGPRRVEPRSDDG